jgi:glycosyltransferase involved in cell wall biosynthesis
VRPGLIRCYTVRRPLIPSTPARYVHHALMPWRRPTAEALRGRTVLWHTLWSDSYSNPRYAELLPRLERLFFAPIRQRLGAVGRLEGGVARRMRFFEHRTLEWYRHGGIELLLTPDPAQAFLFPGPAVVDLDDPTRDRDERRALGAPTLRHVVTPTRETAEYARAANPNVDVTVIPQGVSLESTEQACHDRVRRTLLEGARLPCETPIVGYHAPFLCVSGDAEYQAERFRTFDVDVLLSAVRELWSEGLSFLTVLVGEPSTSVTELATKEKRLVLAGYIERDRLFDWVGAFDIGTYPRTVDFGGRQSVKLLEYMANSAAIVAMSTHETRLLEEGGGGGGSGYRARDPAEFRELLRRLIVSHDERRALIRRGRVVAKEHDWSVLAARYESVLGAATREL